MTDNKKIISTPIAEEIEAELNEMDDKE